MLTLAFLINQALMWFCYMIHASILFSKFFPQGDSMNGNLWFVDRQTIPSYPQDEMASRIVSKKIIGPIGNLTSLPDWEKMTPYLQQSSPLLLGRVWVKKIILFLTFWVVLCYNDIWGPPCAYWKYGKILYHLL